MLKDSRNRHINKLKVLIQSLSEQMHQEISNNNGTIPSMGSFKRASELLKWVKSGNYERILNINIQRTLYFQEMQLAKCLEVNEPF